MSEEGGGGVDGLFVLRWTSVHPSVRPSTVGVSRVMLCIGRRHLAATRAANAHCPAIGRTDGRRDTFTFRQSKATGLLYAVLSAGVCVPTLFPFVPLSLPRECVPNPWGRSICPCAVKVDAAAKFGRVVSPISFTALGCIANDGRTLS